jgi:hypothetical protein
MREGAASALFLSASLICTSTERSEALESGTVGFAELSGGWESADAQCD